MVDVNMPEMDCFEFINGTQLIKDIPIILMSSNVKRGMVEQAVAQGVYFFYMPISAKKLKNIWQHVYRHQKKASQKSENSKANNQVEVMDNTSCANKKMQDTKGKSIVNSAEGSKGKRITDEETQVKNGDSEEEDRSLVSEKAMEKRRRLHWTPDLEKKFKKAVRKLGKKAHPKLIMKMMDIPNLTQKQIANHLQILILARVDRDFAIGPLSGDSR
ncbi:two-component response regulator ARR2-like isoform X1 [Nicotiana tomentosiformis]|uniref:two-component response regulator ARR2-like isoform X1 n=1 Tax=Nicotiana tomentosiformis TaxID=4098 RepID=UPI00388C983F